MKPARSHINQLFFSCNESIKNRPHQLCKIWPWQGRAIRFNKGCRLGVQRDKDEAYKTICKKSRPSQQCAKQSRLDDCLGSVNDYVPRRRV